MAENGMQPNEIISYEEDEALPDAYGLERFMEEINILELEGVYFCPSRTDSHNRAKTTITLHEVSEQPITVAITDYGQPGETAYRVLQAVFFKLSEQGRDTDGVVLFSWREFARLLGTSFGGRQQAKLYAAIKQLQRTEVSCSIRFKARKNGRWEKQWRAVNFTMFNALAFEGSGRGRFTRVAIEIDRRIVENFNNRHVSYFNFERMRGLDMVGMMLYKRFFRHFSNIYRDGMDRNALKFEKDYEQVCTTWLGLQPMRHRSRIEQQLGKHLNALKRVRLLRDYRIEEKADGSGFKVVGFAGAGFFRDYDEMYRKALPAPQVQKIEPEPLVLLAAFHRQLGHEQEEFPPKEVAYARQLLSRYTPDEVRDLMAFGIEEAAKTNFSMQWFSALSLYEKRWVARRQQAEATAAQRTAVAACPHCNEHGYLEFADGSVGSCPHDREQVARIHLRKPILGFATA